MQLKPQHYARRVLPAMAMLAMLAGCSVEPVPVTKQDLVAIVNLDRQVIDANQEPLDGPVTLDEALARAVAYNLDHRTRMMEEALALGQANLARYDMLPVLAATAGYVNRDSMNASSSRSLETQRQSLEPSYSTDRDRFTSDIKLSWNILDFGVSYFQSIQTTNNFMIAKMRQKKAMLRLMQQTRTAFWRAGAAQELRGDINRISLEVRETLRDLDKAQSERVQNPASVLQFKRTLLDLLGQLESLDQALGQSEIELKNLLNIDPTTELRLQLPATLVPLAPLGVAIEQLEQVALQNSADVEELVYTRRVEIAEVRKALLRLLPGLEFSASRNSDTNSFLTNQTWTELSSRVTWNIFRVFTIQSQLDIADAREELATARRLAMNMAVVSRLHLSWRRYVDMVSQLRRSEEIEKLEMEIAALSKGSVAADAGARIERIRNEVSALRAQLRRFETYANAQDALGQIFLALGLNPVPADFRSKPIKQLAENIGSTMRPWERGLFPDPITLDLPIERQGAK